MLIKVVNVECDDKNYRT